MIDRLAECLQANARMALIRRFEDLDTWKEARLLTRFVYRLSATKPLAHDYGLRDQIRRASISCMNNVAEGFDSGSRIELRRSLRYVMRSASEVQSCLYVALDQRFIGPADFQEAYTRATSVRRLCAGLARKVNTGPPVHRRTGEPANQRTGAPPHRRTGAPRKST